MKLRKADLKSGRKKSHILEPVYIQNKQAPDSILKKQNQKQTKQQQKTLMIVVMICSI